ncbi:MAG: hypothetical protein N2V78_12290 [Methanophagales archaeon]|nr:hypothetical protein [Methanophagales archaeon]
MEFPYELINFFLPRGMPGDPPYVDAAKMPCGAIACKMIASEAQS